MINAEPQVSESYVCILRLFLAAFEGCACMIVSMDRQLHPTIRSCVIPCADVIFDEQVMSVADLGWLVGTQRRCITRFQFGFCSLLKFISVHV